MEETGKRVDGRDCGVSEEERETEETRDGDEGMWEGVESRRRGKEQAEGGRRWKGVEGGDARGHMA